MSEYPEDIMKAAGEVTQDSGIDVLFPSMCDDFKMFIAKGIFAERQRCASVAQKWRRKKLGRDLNKATFDPCGRWEGGEIYEEGKERDLIAAEILKGAAA